MDAVDTWLARYPASPVVLDVLGTDDPAAIRAHAFAAEPDGIEIFHFSASVGATFGVRRRDGSRVAVKVNKLFTDEDYFAELHRLQTALARDGFPAPRPVRLVGTTTVDEWLDDGELLDAHDPRVRRAMARELHRFVRLATASGLRPRRTFLRADSELWPTPHNALFDFAATAAGAEWIDEIASRVHRADTVGVEVVGHLDWAAKHVRFDGELAATAVYDWDSVAVEREPVVVGTAAASFTYREEPRTARWPAADESLAFLDEYEQLRGPFTPRERQAALDACVYLRAYAERCAHAVGAEPSDLAAFAEALA